MIRKFMGLLALLVILVSSCKKDLPLELKEDALSQTVWSGEIYQKSSPQERYQVTITFTSESRARVSLQTEVPLESETWCNYKMDRRIFTIERSVMLPLRGPLQGKEWYLTQRKKDQLTFEANIGIDQDWWILVLRRKA